ncbi:Hypothetical protein SRAE_1000014500 [Strongyloides ratti]|uniref:Uncharacterized protein n=1 Tax=Strongyloides ratti TaxID=34506 RepID=A0A090L316_STRRB|nr:Hypothetical protein SRAE_1000014500 [Strongyloides ratti]CEF61869.1 Hypothetical protein SRAE_1000014500 [Strongyloides ratti]
MVLTEEKNNHQIKEEGLKNNENRRNNISSERINQMLKLKSNLNNVVFQRFKEKVNDDQLNEVSEKIEELSNFFEKLLQDSGYEKRPYNRRRYGGFRSHYHNNKRHHDNGNGEQDSKKVDDINDDQNKENDNSQKKVNRKKNFRRNNFRRYNNKKNIVLKSDHSGETEISPDSNMKNNEEIDTKKN